jgi:general secretion pathway protein D
MARTLPVPTVTGNERYPDGAIVSRIIKVKSIPAGQLVPILRPVVPQYGHLVANPCTNTKLIVDTFANGRRLESLVESLDQGPTAFQPEPCVQGDATEKR